MCSSPRADASTIASLIAANLLWSGQGLAVKLLAGRLEPIAIALLPFYSVTAVGALFMLLRPGRAHWARAWRYRRPLVFLGVGGQLLAQAGMTLGVSRSLATNGAILNLLIPPFSAFLSVWLLRERLTWLRIASLLMGILGVLLLSCAGSGAATTAIFSVTIIRTRTLYGDLLIAAGCLGSAFYNVYSKSLLESLSEFEILFFSYMVATVCGLPLLVFTTPHCLYDLVKLGAPSWIAFGYLSLGLYGLSMLLFLHALRQVNAILASTSLYLIPLFGAVLGIAVLHERLGLPACFGVVVTALSALLLIRFDASN
jgi:drug/metabolite transporter (DMT)-like permease